MLPLGVIRAMSKKTVIASDSTCDLSPELIEAYGIHILPLGVALGEKQYTDGVDIDPDFIYAHYEKTGQLPKTSAVNLVDFEDYFAAEIAETCNKLAPCVDASFIIDSLEFLYKGGRCSALAAFGANMLSLKPCIVVKDGKMGVGKKYRGKFGAVLPKYVSERLGDGSDVIRGHIFVTHAGCEPAIIQSCVDSVKAIAPEAKIHITRAGCTISSHCGRNTLGVLFIRTHALGE